MEQKEWKKSREKDQLIKEKGLVDKRRCSRIEKENKFSQYSTGKRIQPVFKPPSLRLCSS